MEDVLASLRGPEKIAHHANQISTGNSVKLLAWNHHVLVMVAVQGIMVGANVCMEDLALIVPYVQMVTLGLPVCKPVYQT